MKVTLFLINKKGYEVLKSILDNEHARDLLDFVVRAKDKGNAEDYYVQIGELCDLHSIKVYNRTNKFKVDSNYSIAIGWKWLIYNVQNLIVFHDSLLPKYRGFAPLPNMLINGEHHIGATAIFANDRMDEGQILYQRSCEIKYPIKIEHAIRLISKIYVDLALTIFKNLINQNELIATPQNHSEATYSIWRDEEDYRICWSKSSAEIGRFIDAVGYPYSGAKTKIGEDIITITDATVLDSYKFELIHPGKILMFEDQMPIVLCGEGALKIKKAFLNDEPYIFSKLRVRFK